MSLSNRKSAMGLISFLQGVQCENSDTGANIYWSAENSDILAHHSNFISISAETFSVLD